MNMGKTAATAGKILGGVAGLAVLIAWSGGCFGHKIEPGKVAEQAGIRLPDGAELYRVTVTQLASRVEVVGTVRSEEEVHLSARLGAYVSGVHASAGARVSKGQVLVTLDDRDAREQLAAAKAQLAQAEAEHERVRKLVEARAATEQSLTAAKSAFDAAVAQVRRVEVMLSYAEIRSPIDGRVTDRNVEAGDLANPGQVLLSVYDPLRMRLEAAVPVRLTGRLPADGKVEVRIDGIGRTMEGRVTEVVGAIEPLSRTQIAKIAIPGASGALPGAYGKVWVYEEHRPAVVVPGSSVYRVGQLEYVQVRAGMRVLRRLVKTGPAEAAGVEVLSGLSAGDEVLVHPVVTARAGEG
jgi:RND family efflux transporter MFP subunit